MKRTQKQPVNLSVTRLFDKVAKHCKSKRARMVLKHIMKKPEMAMLTSLPGAISHYVDEGQSTVNILVYQARSKDIIDHGRWIVLLAYLVNNTDMKINVWLNPAKDIDDDITELRQVIDFIIDNYHQNKVKTHLVQGCFSELVEHIGMDKLDIVFNHNAAVDDHNSPESRACLHNCIRSGVRYVIADHTPINLLFKMAIFEIWGVSSRDTIYKNPYFVAVKKGVSSQYRFMGFTVSLDTLVDEPSQVDDYTKGVLENMASAILDCSNVGESLMAVPYEENGVIRVFEGLEFNPETSIAVGTNSGDRVRIKLPDVSDFPTEAYETDISLDVAKVSWALILYSRFSKELQRLKRTHSQNLQAV